MEFSKFSGIENGDENLGKNKFFTIVNEGTQEISELRGPGVCLITDRTSFASEVRRSLRPLHAHQRNIHIFDLGYYNDENGITSIIDICHKQSIIPVVITEAAGVSDNIENISSNWIVSNKIYSELSSCNFIGYQRHLCAYDDIFRAEEYQYNHISLGKMRSNPAILEPALRDIQKLIIDLGAMRTADAPNQLFTYPTGLNAEEMCQILRHAGTGGQITEVHFKVNLCSEHCVPEAMIIAESIWYFCEGVNIRITDHPLKSMDFTNFIIHSLHVDEDLEFMKHNQTGKWWLKHPKSKEHDFLACSYEEYHASINEELPERIAKFIQAE